MKKYQLQDPKVLVAEGKKRVIKISGGGAVPKHFELNLRLLFGTRDGVKNKSTNERCLALCNLPAMNLIRWAMEHPRTVWSGGRISDRIFRQLVKQTDGHIEVPPCVNEELVRLKSDCFSDNANFASMIHGELDCRSNLKTRINLCQQTSKDRIETVTSMSITR